MASYQVEFAYTGTEDDELTLQIGDIISDCVQKEDGWLEGEINGKRGMFPDNFVKKVTPSQVSKIKSVPPPIPSHKPKLPANEKSSKVIYQAQFPYRASNTDELSFEEGQRIIFKEDVEDGWAKGELESTGDIGLYPTNFVQICEQAAPDPENFKAETKISAEPKLKNSKKNEDENSYYKVAFDYQADNPDELTLNVGDIIKVYNKKSADEGWWEGENLSDSKVGVFPKNFLDQSPVPAPGSAPATSVPANPGVLSNRTKTVVMRDTKPEDKTTRRNIVSEMPISTNNMMDSSGVKSRPKGPNNRRPPKKKLDRNATSPLDENPPMEESDESRVKETITSPTSQARSPSGGVKMPGMAIDMGSLRKKQQKINPTASVRPEPETVPEEKPRDNIPPWQKELMKRNKSVNKSIKPTSTTSDSSLEDESDQISEPWNFAKLSSSALLKRLSEVFVPAVSEEDSAQKTVPIPVTDSQQPPWARELNEKKKSSFNQKDVKPEPVKPEPQIKPEPMKKEPVSPTTAKPQPIAGTRNSFRPSVAPPTSSSQSSSSKISPGPNAKQPSLSDLMREIQGLKETVKSLSRRLDEESNLRKMLEKKVNSLQN